MKHRLRDLTNVLHRPVETTGKSGRSQNSVPTKSRQSGMAEDQSLKSAATLQIGVGYSSA